MPKRSNRLRGKKLTPPQFFSVIGRVYRVLKVLLAILQPLRRSLAVKANRGHLPHTAENLPMIDLDPELDAATKKFEQIQSATPHYSSAELRQFYSFFYNMAEIAIHLKQISGVLRR